MFFYVCGCKINGHTLYRSGKYFFLYTIAWYIPTLFPGKNELAENNADASTNSIIIPLPLNKSFFVQRIYTPTYIHTYLYTYLFTKMPNWNVRKIHYIFMDMKIKFHCFQFHNTLATVKNKIKPFVWKLLFKKSSLNCTDSKVKLNHVGGICLQFLLLGC